MKPFMDNVLWPTLGRVGTYIGGALATYGIAVEHANMIGMGVASAIFVGIDLVTRQIWKDK